MIRFLHKRFCTPVLLAMLLLLIPVSLATQTGKTKLAKIAGTICDAQSQPLNGAEVVLEATGTANPIRIKTDAQGRFAFAAVSAGTYVLRVQSEGYRELKEGPFTVGPDEAKFFTLHLTSASASADTAAAIPFSDEPQFTVAGVTDTTALGVHASSRTRPSSNALAKDTAAMARGEAASAGTHGQETQLRAQLAVGENAGLRFELAELEEKEGHSVEAANDYQRAAQLAPTEAHVFAWGAELLLHRAFEPAIEVFGKGRQRYPQSARMLLGLGATKYAQGSRDEAAQDFVQASDLEPSNPQPYIFLGKLLVMENAAPPAWTERMERFATLNPENATAHYLYGLALGKRAEEGSTALAEAELKKAIELDAHLGNAYLQLGILYSSRKDFAAAIAALQKAVEYTPLPDEAHYRLAEVYRRTGETEKARQETALYKQISAQKDADAERERHEIPQFVYSLRGTAESAPTAPNPH
jgi:tetratricopeptide (TPR) repeat protein